MTTTPSPRPHSATTHPGGAPDQPGEAPDQPGAPAAPHHAARHAPVHHHASWQGDTSGAQYAIETVLAQAGTGTDPATGAITTPIHLSTAYGHPVLRQSTGYDYTRTASPTRDVLQDALALLDGGSASFALSSGMAAVELAVRTLAPHRSRIVALEDLYGGTYRFLEVLVEEGAYQVDFVRGEEGLRRALADPASLVVIETPTNPMMTQFDVATVSTLAHDAGALLVVDNTFLTPYLLRPLELGADAVVYSATKYLGGHNDVMAGVAVVADDVLAERLNYRLNTTGATLGPFDCFLLLRGLKTLALRMERHEANATAIAEFLRSSPHVTRVLYPGHSGMVSFDLAESVDVARFLASVRVFTFAESLGGVESLVTCPSVQTHADVPVEVRASYGLSDRLMRLSVGIEHVDDLIADLAQAFEAAGV